MTVEHFRKADNASQFFECSPLGKEEIEGYHLSNNYLGVWNLRDCPKSHEFDESKQRCVDRKTFRRQQAACTQNPNTSGCQAACTAVNSNPVVGSPCNWLTSQLQRDSASNAYFLQCAPSTPSVGCGEWQRLPCSSGTVFDSNAAVCVPLATQNACGAQQVPVCDCARTQSANSCPGVTTCNNNVCCQRTDVATGNFIQHQAPLCPGSHIAPLASCTETCPQYSSCAPGIGCCPLPIGNINEKPQPTIQITLCPGSYSPPVGTCGSCPTGTLCNQNMKMCCPTATQPSTDIVYNVVLLCPNGSPANTPCGNGCGQGSACYQGACCPISCPVGQNPVGFCSSGACGTGQCHKQYGACCQETIKLPVCSNGQQSNQRCYVDSECGRNMECTNGGCCPTPFCPTGAQAPSRCTKGRTCASGLSCLDGLCCPLPRCPNGIISLGVCSRTLDCGRIGVECTDGACCPLPMCSNNVVSAQRCTTGCNNCCPSGHSCMNGGCCPLPQCPSGIVALSACSGTCRNGAECVNGGCCPLPRCPSGLIATQRCQMGLGCSPGHQCENGVCCPIPMCGTGTVAASVCGTGNSCPIGYVCEGRGCCQEPLPLCPNGGRSAQRCYRGAECPPGYGCTPLGGCCPLSMEPICPMKSTPVCQCSANSVCPSGSSCAMGTCCSTALTSYNHVPGANCQASPQCNGYDNGCSQCVQGVCACSSGSASNGASCIRMPPNVLTLARNGCDQYGSPCKFVFSTARRRPIFAPTGNVTDQPLFFNVAQVRQCLSNSTDLGIDPDSTCLPNEKCINGECRMKLWPGEYGCSTDLECSSRCPNTYCEKRKSDKNVAQCQCRDGMLLYGRCFSQCPRGFHESGAYCMHDDEDGFWSDADAQNNLKALLNGGQC
ncbi:unnamed protein product [Auanema sp. JU1783]|nr:unnamed protein product [Auanema sp. JU1783]